MNLSSTFGYSPRPPVSVSGTGACGLQLSGFSREPAPRDSPLGRGLAVLSGLGTPGDFPPGARPTSLQRALPSARTRFAPPSPPRSRSRRRNLQRLPIGLAPRLSLRPRLTLIRLALIRNPWSSGGRVSRPPSRYLCLHLLFHPLQHPSRGTFDGDGMLPYRLPSGRPVASVACFMPAYYPCPPARPVSCYALFECMAASKPTSWLSLRMDRVISNLTRTWGPWPSVWILLLSAADVSTRGLAPGRWMAAFGVCQDLAGGEAPASYP